MLVDELRKREESELVALMERIGIKVGVAITSEQLDQLNRLFWCTYFALQEKKHER